MMVDNERPPYAEFERRAVEDRTQSIAQGHYVAVDVDYVKLMRPGSRDIHEERVDSYLQKLEIKAKDGMVPPDWPQKFKAHYEAWKNDQAIPLEGIPIRGWNALSPATQETVIRNGIKTVEDLAALPEGEFQKFGIGALSLKTKARAWLSASGDTGKAAERMAALEQKNRELQETIQRQAEQLAQLVREQKKAA